MAGSYDVRSGWPSWRPGICLGWGPEYVISPTFGYTLGFIVASYVTGRYARPATFTRILRASFLALAIVYCLGASWLATWFIFIKGLSIISSITYSAIYGIVLFIPWDTLKLLIASYTSYKLLKVLYRV